MFIKTLGIVGFGYLSFGAGFQSSNAGGKWPGYREHHQNDGSAEICAKGIVSSREHWLYLEKQINHQTRKRVFILEVKAWW